MALQRLSLEDAGKLLGLHPNSVRARAKKGRIPSEFDNSGKIWVMIDPEKAANDKPTKSPTKSAAEPSLKVTIQEVSAAFEGTISALKSENEGLKITVEDLRSRLDQSETERRRLVDALLQKPAPQSPQEPRGRLGWLSSWFGRGKA